MVYVTNSIAFQFYDFTKSNIKNEELNFERLKISCKFPVYSRQNFLVFTGNGNMKRADFYRDREYNGIPVDHCYGSMLSILSIVSTGGSVFHKELPGGWRREYDCS